MSEPIIAFGRDPAAFADMEYAAFLKAVQWNRSAPPGLAKAARSGDVDEFARGLARRRGIVRKGGGRKRLSRPALNRPSLWSAASFEESLRSAELVRIWKSFGFPLKRPDAKRAVASDRRSKAKSGKLGKPSPAIPAGWSAAENELADWLDGVTSAAPVEPYELLVLFEMLLAAGRALSPPACWKLWRAALTGAIALAIEVDDPPTETAAEDRRVVVAGELPFLAGLLFAGIKGSAKFGRRGARFLAKALLDLTDTDGTPQAELLERLPLWLAGLSRARQWAEAFQHPLWNDEAETRFELLLQTVTPMCRADGTLALSNGFATNAVPILAAAALATGFRRKSRPMRLLGALPLAPQRDGKRTKKRPGKSRAKRGGQPVARRTGGPRPTTQSDWA
ncbi:MAG: hypothetical protein ACE5KM_21080, partial [Planctomycetaceae bacterium]